MWSTGAGLTAAQTVELVVGAGLDPELTLLDDPALWGGPTTDERYLVTAVSDADEPRRPGSRRLAGERDVHVVAVPEGGGTGPDPSAARALVRLGLVAVPGRVHVVVPDHVHDAHPPGASVLVARAVGRRRGRPGTPRTRTRSRRCFTETVQSKARPSLCSEVRRRGTVEDPAEATAVLAHDPVTELHGPRLRVRRAARRGLVGRVVLDRGRLGPDATREHVVSRATRQRARLAS